MDKHFIEKPKKPVCFETANVVVMVVTTIILCFTHILFLAIFVVAMTVFIIYCIYDYKHMPEAILYNKGFTLYYYKKGLTEIKLKDINEIKVSFDKKQLPYININYNDRLGIKQELVIRNDDASSIVDDLNDLLTKARNNKK